MTYCDRDGGCYICDRIFCEGKREAIMSENRCVCCGEVIPEGRQCCRECVDKYMENERKARYTAVALKKDGTQEESSGTLAEMTKWADKMWAANKVTEINIRRISP